MTWNQQRVVQNALGRTHLAQWTIDLAVAGATQDWAADTARLQREIEAMQAMYPAWVLTLSDGRNIVTRKRHQDVAVPVDGCWRWAGDGERVALPRTPSLAWQGPLPAPLAGLKTVEKRLRGRYPLENMGGRIWTAVPVRVVYLREFPRREPTVYYDEAWLDCVGARMGAATHLLHGGVLCLFYPGHWKRGFTVADVLSQRVVNHLYSTLKIAHGACPDEAFIGRVHNNNWRPKR